MLSFLYLHHNKIEELPRGLVDGLTRVKSLALQNNLIHTLPSEFFRAMDSVVGIDVSSNNISGTISAGTFANPSLRYVSLAHNTIRHVEAGAFNELLDNVWLTGNNMTCPSLADVEDARCTEEGVCDAVAGVANLGNGICEVLWDPGHMTAGCLWDGGDCK